MKNFEVGVTYKSESGTDTIKVSKRSDKSIWFGEDEFSARIKVENDVEVISPSSVGIARETYKASSVVGSKPSKITKKCESCGQEFETSKFTPYVDVCKECQKSHGTKTGLTILQEEIMTQLSYGEGYTAKQIAELVAGNIYMVSGSIGTLIEIDYVMKNGKTFQLTDTGYDFVDENNL